MFYNEGETLDHLAGEAVEVPSLEEFKASLDRALSNLV